MQSSKPFPMQKRGNKTENRGNRGTNVSTILGKNKIKKSLSAIFQNCTAAKISPVIFTNSADNTIVSFRDMCLNHSFNKHGCQRMRGAGAGQKEWDLLRPEEAHNPEEDRKGTGW